MTDRVLRLGLWLATLCSWAGLSTSLCPVRALGPIRSQFTPSQRWGSQVVGQDRTCGQLCLTFQPTIGDPRVQFVVRGDQQNLVDLLSGQSDQPSLIGSLCVYISYKRHSKQGLLWPSGGHGFGHDSREYRTRSWKPWVVQLLANQLHSATAASLETSSGVSLCPNLSSSKC